MRLQVDICVGAASPNRPVCPGANQLKCPEDGLYDRNGTFTHLVQTADPIYTVVGRQANGTYKFTGSSSTRGVGFMKVVGKVCHPPIKCLILRSPLGHSYLLKDTGARPAPSYSIDIPTHPSICLTPSPFPQSNRR